jgi:hypothetical protein
MASAVSPFCFGLALWLAFGVESTKTCHYLLVSGLFLALSSFIPHLAYPRQLALFYIYVDFIFFRRFWKLSRIDTDDIFFSIILHYFYYLHQLGREFQFNY